MSPRCTLLAGGDWLTALLSVVPWCDVMCCALLCCGVQASGSCLLALAWSINSWWSWQHPCSKVSILSQAVSISSCHCTGQRWRSSGQCAASSALQSFRGAHKGCAQGSPLICTAAVASCCVVLSLLLCRPACRSCSVPQRARQQVHGCQGVAAWPGPCSKHHPGL